MLYYFTILIWAIIVILAWGLATAVIVSILRLIYLLTELWLEDITRKIKKRFRNRRN